MSWLFNRNSLALLALATFCGGVVPAVEAQERPARSEKDSSTSSVIDDAGMFSDEAIRRAKEMLARVDRTYKLAVTIETVDSLRGQEIEEFAIRRAEMLGHQGIFVLVARQDRKAEALAAPKSFREEIGKPRLKAIVDAMSADFKQGKTDEGLIDGVRAAEKALAAIRPDVARDAAVTQGGTTSGADSPLVARNQPRLTLAGARKAIDGAEAKAMELKLKVSVSVVDEVGNLMAFARMDGAPLVGVSNSHSGAAFAAIHGIDNGPASLPIRIDGKIVGAIGVVSSIAQDGTPIPADGEAAKAGIAALVAALNEPTAPASVPAPAPR